MFTHTCKAVLKEPIEGNKILIFAWKNLRNFQTNLLFLQDPTGYGYYYASREKKIGKT